ncbi:cyclic nucleotide-binding domain protein (macronuclear) [Tetrahymena thermophila SB210]|uniref:Cyclic nucleotide-binding domain protein n=1 Tax=Tetrahymena thermophila (strain SB210) TaxID=312017 RepID=Q23G12_TETTS|nr:cyclic nucleotide-binding domain protein [Tetrahymena thermophila SB210]EAR95448.2 cyclic nucleotide-binding domain protein [Tetrahymena thermophila SB210]|eukprot:XP_001015693.2 cyclic nucleotide-binding domain protein [Tetrahymena thermophila SB210]
MSQDMNQIQNQFCKRIKRYYLIQIFNLIFKMFMIAHTIGCLWYLIGLYEQKVLNVQTWFDQMFEPTNVWWQLYIYSFYWSLQLMIMGSNTANSIIQISFTIFVTFITAITFGYILNVIGMILEELDSNEISKRHDINVINEYMRQKNISMDLQTQINLDLNYFYEKNIKQNQQDVENAVSNLSSEIRMKLKLEQNLQVLKKISFFEKNFSKESLLEYASTLEEITYYPNQTILLKDKSEDSIIYIDSGKVEVTKYCKNNQNDSHYSQIFLEGQYFGQQNFFTGNTNEFHCISQGFTKIVKLNRQTFVNIIQNEERDYEIFCQIRDNIQFYDNLKELGDKCTNCSSRCHSALKCPRVYFDRFSVFQKCGILESKLQSRSSKKRRKYKLNSLNINIHINYVALEYINGLQSKYLESILKTETKIGEEEISFRLLSDQNSQNTGNILKGEQKNNEDIIQTDQIKQSYFQKIKLYTQQSMDGSNFLSQHSYDKYLDEQIQSSKMQYLSKITKQLSRQSNNEPEQNSVIEIDSSNQQSEEGICKLEEDYNEEQNLNKNKEQFNQKQLALKFKKKITSQSLDQKFVSFFDQNGNSYEQKDTNVLSPYQLFQSSLSNNFPWNFEMQKDYKFYFVYGNLKYQLIRIQKAQIKNLKRKMKKKKIL